MRPQTSQPVRGYGQQIPLIQEASAKRPKPEVKPSQVLKQQASLQQLHMMHSMA